MDFADLEYTSDGMRITPNGGLKDSTELLNGKTFGEYVDYIDNTVLEKGRYVNKEFLRDLIAVNLIDMSYANDNNDNIESIIAYCTSVANNLYKMDIDLHKMEIELSKPTDYKLFVTANGTDDIWHCDFLKEIFSFNDGKTIYNSTMFDDETLDLWAYAVEDFKESR